jgi:hypothetical protein
VGGSNTTEVRGVVLVWWDQEAALIRARDSCALCLAWNRLLGSW